MTEPVADSGARRLAIGVDVGGTFTDVVCVAADGELRAAKVPTVPGRQHLAVIDAAQRILETMAASPDSVERFVHGTTVATNAIIERTGARVGTLMTAGFEDTLEFGRYKRSQNYDIWFDAETPVFLAPKRRRRGIRERIDYDGNVLVSLNEDDVVAALHRLVEHEKVEALAVCYLFAYRSPAHELRTREIAQELYPELAVSLSCEVNPEIREYERLCITAFDAYVKPVIEGYLTTLMKELRRIGIDAPLQIMESRGGIADATRTVLRPVATLMSGPAAGVIGAQDAAVRDGFKNVISIDIGGTSSDVSLAVAGDRLLSREARIETYPIRTPMVDVSAIGAGGGSIVWFDEADGLHVGPASAGASPGPACYGRGGEDATVTDASLVLGFLDPHYFAGGTLSLDRELAERALSGIAHRLGCSLPEAAWGVHRIVNANMIDQIRLASISRGYDPRRFALVLLGGGGGLHGCPVAEGLGIETLLVPLKPGVLSAFGLLVADVDHEQTRTFHVAVSDLATPSVHEELSQLCASMDRLGRDALSAQRVPSDAVDAATLVEARYVGQSYELEIPLADGFVPEVITDLFEQKHASVYGFIRQGDAVEILNVRTIHKASAPPNAVRPDSDDMPIAEGGGRSRQVYFEGGLVDTPVYQRSRVAAGTEIHGPAIVEQADTTTVIFPGWRGCVRESQQLVLTRS